jgi:hypothetical protein
MHSHNQEPWQKLSQRAENGQGPNTLFEFAVEIERLLVEKQERLMNNAANVIIASR